MKGGQPPIFHLEVLTVLAENSDVLVCRSNYGIRGGTGYFFTDLKGVRDPELSKLFEGKPRFDLHGMDMKGYIASIEVKENTKYYNYYYQITDKGREIATSQQGRLREHREELIKEHERISRLIVIRNSRDCLEPRRFAAICRVNKETETRLYIDDEYIDAYGDSRRYIETIHGQRGRQYVNKEDVEVDQVSSELFQKLVQVETGHKNWLRDLNAAEADEISPIKERFKQRRTQQAAAIEDAVKQAVKEKNDRKA